MTEMTEPDEKESSTEAIDSTGATFIVSSEPVGDLWCDCGAGMCYVGTHMMDPERQDERTNPQRSALKLFVNAKYS
jgi:hypothetical protein